MEEEKEIEVEERQVETKKPKKKRKFLKRLLIFLVILGSITLALGFIFPGLLWLKDLGIRYTKEDYTSIMNKLNYTKDEVPTGSSRDAYEYIYGVVSNINVEFTNEEITAFINEERPSYFPIKNVQVRVNNDGTIEAVGVANVDYFLNEVLGGKYTRDQIKKEIPALNLLPSHVNLYIDFSGSIINNKVDTNIYAATVQGIPLPTNMIRSSEATKTVTDGVNKIISKYNTNSGSSFDKIATEKGKIVAIGKFPSSLKRVAK